VDGEGVGKRWGKGRVNGGIASSLFHFWLRAWRYTLATRCGVVYVGRISLCTFFLRCRLRFCWLLRASINYVYLLVYLLQMRWMCQPSCVEKRRCSAAMKAARDLKADVRRLYTSATAVGRRRQKHGCVKRPKNTNKRYASKRVYHEKNNKR